MWAPGGNELFYRNEDKMMAVTFETNPEFKPAAPTLLFEEKFLLNGWTNTYDVHPDGNKFLMIKEDEAPAESAIRTPISVVINWFEELKRLAPVKKE